jgi:hypothetical protein
MLKEHTNTKGMLPLRDTKLKRSWTTLPVDEPTLSLEQEALTAPTVERLWLLITMALVVLALSIYWMTEQGIEQPAWVYQTPTSAATLAELTPAATSAYVLISADPEPPRAMSMVKASSTSVPVVLEQDVQLIKRFYDEVLGRQNYAVMPELFAPEIHYRDGEQAVTSITVETFTRLLRAERSDYDSLLYTADRVMVDGSWIWVQWAAQQWPPAEKSDLSPVNQSMIWSGATFWRVSEGKIVGLWTDGTVVRQR